jgi:putative ABC transport system permease protein
MNIAAVAAKNVLRNKFRTVLTVAGVAVAILAFVMLRTVLSAWTVAAEAAAKDRIASRHKVTFVMTLPKRYVDKIRETPGVTAASYFNWFGGKIAGKEDEFFANMLVEPKTFFEVYDEISVPEDQKTRFMENRKGALVGHVLAKKMGWKIGDRITLVGTIFPGDWELEIAGIYTATRKSIDQSSLWFHWDYVNEALPESRKDQVGWIVSRIDDPAKSADISAAIDKRFDDEDIQTLTMSERALQMSFLGMVSAVLKAIDVVSLVILLIMMLILGNTIAMGVRERTSEYAVLRAIGFLPHHVITFVLGEAVVIGLIGGGLGLLLAYPLVEQGMGRFIEENMGSWFPYFRIADTTAIAAPLLAIALALVAAAIPAYRASKQNVVDGLRRVG